MQQKIFGQLRFSGQALVAQKSWMIKNACSIKWKISGHPLFFRVSACILLKTPECKKYIQYSEKLQGTICFSGQAQATQNFWIIKNICSMQWKISGQLCFFRASTSCSKILNVKSIFHTAKNLRATLFFMASASCSKFLNV